MRRFTFVRAASTAAHRARKVAPPRSVFKAKDVVKEEREKDEINAPRGASATGPEDSRSPDLIYECLQSEGDRARGYLFLAAGLMQFVFSLSMADLARNFWGRKDKETGKRGVAGPWERNLVAIAITAVSGGILAAVLLTPTRIARSIRINSENNVIIVNSLPLPSVSRLIGLRSTRVIPLIPRTSMAHMKGDPRFDKVGGGQTKYITLKFDKDRFGYLVDRTGWFRDRNKFGDILQARKV